MRSTGDRGRQCFVGCEPFEGADDWVEAVAKRARWDPTEARTQLTRQQIRPPAAWGAPRHLHIEGLLFAGVKTLTDDPVVPYIFHLRFSSGITAFGTHNENDAGKSSVIRTIRWALRGRCQLQPDVRQWMRAVVLELRIDDERLAVAFGVDAGRPSGVVLRLRNAMSYDELSGRLADPVEDLRTLPHAGAEIETTQPNDVYVELMSYLRDLGSVEVAAFGSDQDFERVMNDVMLDRLSFPRVLSWQRRPKERQAYAGEGILSELGWPTWSNALSITAPHIPVVLGDETHAVSRLLQIYLGSPWATTAAALTARKGQLSSQMGILQRRIEDQQAGHRTDIDGLQRRLASIDRELDELPEQIDLADLDNRVREATEAGRSMSSAEARYRNESLGYGNASRLLDEAEADLAALREAQLTRRFWHALKPSCCPRCETDVTEDRWARERTGQCSLCNSPLQTEQPAGAGAVDGAVGLDAATLEALLASGEADIDALDDLTAAQVQVRELQQQLHRVDAARDEARRERDEAQRRWEAAQEAVRQPTPSSLSRWQALTIERAVLQARIDERGNVRPVAQLEQQLAEVARLHKLIAAAETEAKARQSSDQLEPLNEVSQQVAALGKSLGVRNLEAVRLQTNGHMPATKAGVASQNFGDLEDGEKLRLKIALMVALMRVGEEAGVARHPGLVMIDSLGREELNPRNMIDMLRELVTLTQQVPHLQILLTSAHGNTLLEGLGGDRVKLAPPGQPLW